MKKISLLFACVLFSTLVFANSADEPVSSSSVAVVKTAGTSLYKLHYSSYMKGDVKVSIFNASGKLIYNESIRKTDGFIRPYNFSEMIPGTYTLQIESPDGKRIEMINYTEPKIDKLVNIVKLSEPGKFLLAGVSSGKDKINVSIYNSLNEIIFSHDELVAGEFAQVLNLQKLSDYTIEVSDSSGVIKTIKK